MLTLLCLVDRDTTSQAFSVHIDPTKTVYHLKELIKTQVAPRFDDVGAMYLTLWHVDQAIIPANKHDPVLLCSISSPTELIPFDHVSNVFQETPAKETIHIIVQRRLPAGAIQKKYVPNDQIEKELAVVLKHVSHHQITEPIDPKDVEALQREKLGLFYNRNLPYGYKATDPSLVTLGLEGLDPDKQAKTSDGETLRSIVEGDIGKLSGHRVVAMVAANGLGKTATVIDIASQHFVIYCVCHIPHVMMLSEFRDDNFLTLVDDVEKICRNVINRRIRRDPLYIDSEVKRLVGERIELEFLARLLFLQLLLDNDPALEPRQFFHEQVYGRASDSNICKLVDELKQYDHFIIKGMLDVAQTKLQSLLVPRKLGLVIALDEAHIAVFGILRDRFISPSALLKEKGNLFDDNNQIQNKFRRGFLMHWTTTLSNMQATLVILGTTRWLLEKDHVFPAIDKPNRLSFITDFPRFDATQVYKILSDLIDLSGCDISPIKLRLMSGRPQFSMGIVRRLMEIVPKHDLSKQEILNGVINLTRTHIMTGLRKRIRCILEDDKTGKDTRLLSRMVLGYHLEGGNITFFSNQQSSSSSDFIQKALCSFQSHSDGIHLILTMDEQMVMEAVQIELEYPHKDVAFSQCIDQMYQILRNLSVISNGESWSDKGITALQPLVRKSIQRLNGFRLIDLPFLQSTTTELPKWCNDFQLEIGQIDTFIGLGYASDFFIHRPSNKMIISNGFWFFSDNSYAGYLSIHLESHHSLLQHDENHQTWSDIPDNLKGILRIHLEFPPHPNRSSVIQKKIDPQTGTENVIVYIDMLDNFFNQKVFQNQDENMVKLKNLIKFVCTDGSSSIQP